MRILKRYQQLAIGCFTGSLIMSVIILIWLSGLISINRYGEVTITNFPKGIRKVTFDSDLVAITVGNEIDLQDFRFKPWLLARCKDREYGEIIGMAKKNHYFFHYANFTTGPYGPAPLNDVHKVYPITR